MVWIAVSLVIVLVSVVLIAGAARRQAPAPSGTHLAARPDDSIATRVRRLEDDTADLAAQVTELREDVQYLMRQLEDRP